MSSVCADLVMSSKLPEIALSELDITQVFFKRYVDDIITLIHAYKEHIILNTFNIYHSKLEFTVEVGNNGKLPFLNDLVIRTNTN